jgi:hypothetical protein
LARGDVSDDIFAAIFRDVADYMKSEYCKLEEFFYIRSFGFMRFGLKILTQGCTNIKKQTEVPPKNFGRHEGVMRQVSYSAFANLGAMVQTLFACSAQWRTD